MLVTADVGNTLTKLATIRDGRVSTVVRVPSRRDALTVSLAPALRQLVGDEAAEGATITCVVPSLTDRLVMAIQDMGVARPMVLQKRTWPTFRTQYRGDLGADRIANVAAVRDSYPLPAVVIDLGTATKLDAIGACGEHLGGAIAPGLGLGNDALGRRCALLRPTALHGTSATSIPNTTAQAVRGGAIWGHAGLIDGLVARFAQELGEPKTVIATGGWAPLVARHATSIQECWPVRQLDVVTFCPQLEVGSRRGCPTPEGRGRLLRSISEPLSAAHDVKDGCSTSGPPCYRREPEGR